MTPPSSSDLSPELQSLLRAQADAVPHRDLGDGFLQDLHTRLEQPASPWLTLRSQFTRFSEASAASFSNLFWGGSAIATAVLAIGLGLFLADRDSKAGFTQTQGLQPQLIYVKADERVDTSGTIPAFHEQPFEF